MKSKKPLYEIRVRGQVPEDLVDKISELHAKTILLTKTSISKKQDGRAVSGDEKVQSPLPLRPAKNSVLNSPKAQE